MTCASCGDHVTKALRGAGAVEVAVDWQAGVARFVWPEEVPESALREAVSAAGYTPQALEAESARSAPEPAGPVDYDLLVLGGGVGGVRGGDQG